MATTRDLSNLIDRHHGEGQGPFFIRMCQDADILPRGKQGGSRSLAPLTPQHLADFVMALAGTRVSGTRNASVARAAAQRFGRLTFSGDAAAPTPLRDDLAACIRDAFGVVQAWQVSHVVFTNHPGSPEAEIRFIRLQDDQQVGRRYWNPKKAEPETYADAFVVYAGFLQDLSELLRDDDETEVA